MANRLNPNIIKHLETKLGKTAAQIRPRISEIRRRNSALTLNAAAQVYAEKNGTSVLTKLNPEDRQSLGIYQQVKSVTNNVNYNKSHINKSITISADQISNLIAGHYNTGNIIVKNDLESALMSLADEVKKSLEINDDDKNEIMAEVGTILSQSKKSTPDKDTIKKSWASLSVFSKFAGIAGSIATVGEFLHQLGLI